MFELVARRAREVEHQTPETSALRVTASTSMLATLLDEFAANGGAVHHIGNDQFLFGHILIRMDNTLPQDCFKIELRET